MQGAYLMDDGEILVVMQQQTIVFQRQLGNAAIDGAPHRQALAAQIKIDSRGRLPC